MTAAGRIAGRAMARGAVAGWLQIAVAFVVAPAHTALLLAFLPREEAGFWMVVLSLAAYFNLFDLGLGPTLARFIAFTRQVEPAPRGATSTAYRAPAVDDATPADLYATARRLYRVLASALAAVGLMIGPTLISRATGQVVDGARLTAWLLFLGGCVASVLSTPAQAAVAGSGAVAVPRVARAAAQLAGLAAAALALASGYGVVGVAGAWAAQNALLFAAGPVLLRRYFPEISRRGEFRSAVARRLVRPSLQLAGINLGGALILASGPLIVAAQSGSAAVPQFIVLRQLAEAMYMVALVPAQVSEPFVSRGAATGDLAAVTALLRRNVRYVGALLAIAAPIAAVLGGEVIAAWVGAANFAGYASLWLMIALYALEAHHVLHAATVIATGRVVFLLPALLAGATTIGLGVGLGREWGVPGVILGMFVAQLATNNWYAPWYALRHLGVRASTYAGWLRPLVPVAGASTALALATRHVLRTATHGTPVATLCALAALGAATLPLVWFVALTPDERLSLARVWRGASSGS